LADDDTAEALFAAALSADLSGYPLLRARTLFAQGRWLHRRRRNAAARAPLRAAADQFAALGAASWNRRARLELRATGERTTSSSTDRNALTAQEQQIAELAAQGLSNREIASRLFLSPRTVSSHLYRIFPKLGITTSHTSESESGTGSRRHETPLNPRLHEPGDEPRQLPVPVRVRSHRCHPTSDRRVARDSAKRHAGGAQPKHHGLRHQRAADARCGLHQQLLDRRCIDLHECPGKPRRPHPHDQPVVEGRIAMTWQRQQRTPSEEFERRHVVTVQV
jgi:DNA-binding CsgD family transcriptional regulator